MLFQPGQPGAAPGAAQENQHRAAAASKKAGEPGKSRQRAGRGNAPRRQGQFRLALGREIRQRAPPGQLLPKLPGILGGHVQEHALAKLCQQFDIPATGPDAKPGEPVLRIALPEAKQRIGIRAVDRVLAGIVPASFQETQGQTADQRVQHGLGCAVEDAGSLAVEGMAEHARIDQPAP
ncbi:MAG: hypothetical protein K6E40_07295 [Desulfovibrio sp.]|nr:hypothetical protein [Desulfovibrio sp.]